MPPMNLSRTKEMGMMFDFIILKPISNFDLFNFINFSFEKERDQLNLLITNVHKSVSVQLDKTACPKTIIYWGRRYSI
jgi:hypothetical protein